MKKIFYILSIILVAGLLTACTNNVQPTSPTSSLEENTNLDLNPGENLGLQTNEQTTMSIKNQVDLTKEYSQAVINTSLGKITVKFYTEESPVTVNNFLNLAQAGFYNNTKFHRVIKDFMIQGGDPNSKEAATRLYGIGGPGYKFADEINNRKLVAGSLAMANSGTNTNGSQFFIVTAPETPWLDGMHTNFGEVVSGMDVVHQIENVQTGERDIPTTPVVINSIQLLK